jgi:hypothetical protein
MEGRCYLSALLYYITLSTTKLRGERERLHYDLFAISRVLPTVHRIHLSCIFLHPCRRAPHRQVVST